MKGSLDSFWIRSLSMFLSLSDKSPSESPSLSKKNPISIICQYERHLSLSEAMAQNPNTKKASFYQNVIAGQSFQCDLLI